MTQRKHAASEIGAARPHICSLTFLDVAPANTDQKWQIQYFPPDRFLLKAKLQADTKDKLIQLSIFNATGASI